MDKPLKDLYDPKVINWFIDGCEKALAKEKESKTLTALEYMEKQLQKHRLNYERELMRGVSEEMLYNIALKCDYYKSAVEALREREDE